MGKVYKAKTNRQAEKLAVEILNDIFERYNQGKPLTQVQQETLDKLPQVKEGIAGFMQPKIVTNGDGTQYMQSIPVWNEDGDFQNTAAPIKTKLPDGMQISPLLHASSVSRVAELLAKALKENADLYDQLQKEKSKSPAKQGSGLGWKIATGVMGVLLAASIAIGVGVNQSKRTDPTPDPTPEEPSYSDSLPENPEDEEEQEQETEQEKTPDLTPEEVINDLAREFVYNKDQLKDELNDIRIIMGEASDKDVSIEIRGELYNEKLINIMDEAIKNGGCGKSSVQQALRIYNDSWVQDVTAYEKCMDEYSKGKTTVAAVQYTLEKLVESVKSTLSAAEKVSDIMADVHLNYVTYLTANTAMNAGTYVSQKYGVEQTAEKSDGSNI